MAGSLTDACLAGMAALSQLTRLDVGCMRVTREGKQQLRAARPQLHVSADCSGACAAVVARGGGGGGSAGCTRCSSALACIWQPGRRQLWGWGQNAPSWSNAVLSDRCKLPQLASCASGSRSARTQPPARPRSSPPQWPQHCARPVGPSASSAQARAGRLWWPHGHLHLLQLRWQCGS